jgi:hypothetical protein
MLGGKLGSMSIWCSMSRARFCWCGLLSSFSSWTVCTLCTHRRSRLCRTLCSVIHGTYNSLDAWQIDLVRPLWNTLWICSTFSLDTLLHIPPDCFWTIPVSKTCQTRPWWFYYLVHYHHKLANSFFAPLWRTSFLHTTQQPALAAQGTPFF